MSPKALAVVALAPLLFAAARPSAAPAPGPGVRSCSAECDRKASDCTEACEAKFTDDKPRVECKMECIHGREACEKGCK